MGVSWIVSDATRDAQSVREILDELEQFASENVPRDMEEVRESRICLTEDDMMKVVVKTNFSLWRAQRDELDDAIEAVKDLLRNWEEDYHTQDLSHVS